MAYFGESDLAVLAVSDCRVPHRFVRKIFKALASMEEEPTGKKVLIKKGEQTMATLWGKKRICWLVHLEQCTAIGNFFSTWLLIPIERAH